MIKIFRRWWFRQFGTLLLSIIVTSGCSVLVKNTLDQRFGESIPVDRTLAQLAVNNIDFWHDVKPILNKRCAVCHGCYDAPCQLKLTAVEGLERGLVNKKVYQSSRLSAAEPTRLFEDASTIEQWREKGFYSVLNERADLAEAHREASVLYQSLQLKSQAPDPQSELLPATVTLDSNREEVCPKAEDMEKFKAEHPEWGMPYGLPKLALTEQRTLMAWVEQGARYTSRQALPAHDVQNIADWESFLNQNSLKAQLMARYLYEHLFLAQLYFDDEARFFSLVRSATPPGSEVKRITTRRPFDNPGVERTYYRLVPNFETAVYKRHMPYRLNAKRKSDWQRWFLDAGHEVERLPSYDKGVTANPFISFKDIPVKSRYQFLLDEAQFTIMNFIKGSVCRGPVALNVIRDHFWVFFVNPDIEAINTGLEKALSQYSMDFSLPSTEGDVYLSPKQWKRYAENEEKLRAGRDAFFVRELVNVKIDQNIVWDGYERNSNAALTVFRHYNSASVEKGLLGDAPTTSWLIGYPLLERIHYLLVAGYDVYGNVGHQLMSRLHMDFLRMEGESTFLMLLPQSAREAERQFWYRGASEDRVNFLKNPEFEKKVQPAILYHTDQPKFELYKKLKQYLAPVLSEEHKIDTLRNRQLYIELKKLAEFNGEPTQVLPEISFLEVRSSDTKDYQYFSILKNTAHYNITSLFREKKNLVPAENTISVLKGFVGAHPNALFSVDNQDLRNFVAQLMLVNDEQTFSQIMSRYGVRRTAPNFWQISDRFHQFFVDTAPIEFGYFDYNRLQNR